MTGRLTEHHRPTLWRTSRSPRCGPRRAALVIFTFCAGPRTGRPVRCRSGPPHFLRRDQARGRSFRHLISGGWATGNPAWMVLARNSLDANDSVEHQYHRDVARCSLFVVHQQPRCPLHLNSRHPDGRSKSGESRGGRPRAKGRDQGACGSRWCAGRVVPGGVCTRSAVRCGRWTTRCAGGPAAKTGGQRAT